MTKLYFTADAIAGLKPRPKQYLAWDAWDNGRKRGADPARGLCVLVSPGGAKSYRALFYFRGNPATHYQQISRVGELLERGPDESQRDHLTREIEEARRRARNARLLAKPSDPDGAPQDPRAGIANRKDTFEKVVRDYTQHVQIGERQNSSATSTQGFILNSCAAWLPYAIATIRYDQVEKLLWAIRDGDPEKGIKPRPAAAVRLFAHLRDLFKWAARPSGPLKTSPILGMSAPGKIRGRTNVFTDADLKAIWKAAVQLTPGDASYVKLAMLLGLRREELALARWSEFEFNKDGEPVLFTVPSARVKMKAARKLEKHPVYRVPLPPLAQRIISGLPKYIPRRPILKLPSQAKQTKGLPKPDDLLFPDFNANRLKAALVKHGAPENFILHTFRHTVATWLENKGRSEWERGLVLNHSGGGGVTGGYSHGYALDLKRTMLTEWAAHIEALVQPAEGVTLLR